MVAKESYVGSTVDADGDGSGVQIAAVQLLCVGLVSAWHLLVGTVGMDRPCPLNLLGTMVVGGAHCCAMKFHTTRLRFRWCWAESE